MVFTQTGRPNETDPQPFHLHGHRFWVIGQEIYNSTAFNLSQTADNSTSANDTEDLPQPPENIGFTRLHALSMFTKNLLYRNFWHPIIKDSIMIPAGGYTIIRFQAYNKG